MRSFHDQSNQDYGKFKYIYLNCSPSWRDFLDNIIYNILKYIKGVKIILLYECSCRRIAEVNAKLTNASTGKGTIRNDDDKSALSLAEKSTISSVTNSLSVLERGVFGTDYLNFLGSESNSFV